MAGFNNSNPYHFEITLPGFKLAAFVMHIGSLLENPCKVRREIYVIFYNCKRNGKTHPKSSFWVEGSEFASRSPWNNFVTWHTYSRRLPRQIQLYGRDMSVGRCSDAWHQPYKKMHASNLNQTRKQQTALTALYAQGRDAYAWMVDSKILRLSLR